MRLLCLLVMWSLLWVGCAANNSGTPSTGAAGGTPDPALTSTGADVLVTPGGVTTGTVALVNPNARYVVVSYPIGTVPRVDTRLNIYRDGLKVGEIKITGPQRDNNTVGDLLAGEARKGDEVRSN